MNNIAKGTKVRVTYEAEYKSSYDEQTTRYGHVVEVSGHRLGSDAATMSALVPNDATIEPIEDLRPGDVVLDANNEWARYDALTDHFPWSRFYDSHAWGDSEIHRPFKLHIRDGQVQP